MADGWKRVVTAVHAQGGRIFLQLWHCGRASHSDFHGGELPVAPSAIKIDGDTSTPPGQEALRDAAGSGDGRDPAIVADYRMAAERAKSAGFDGVEVHSANGYLLDTFLQSKTNHRDDAYGGSIENRYRMLGEVVGLSPVSGPIASACGSPRTASSTTWARPTTAGSSPTSRNS